MSEEALQKTEKKREAEGKGEKERYTKRGKKTFLSQQCKEIEENSRMGKTRDLFRKIADIKGTFHARMGMIKEVIWT